MKTIKKTKTYTLEVATTIIHKDKDGHEYKSIPMSFDVQGAVRTYKLILQTSKWEKKSDEEFKEVLEAYYQARILESLGVTTYPIPEKEVTQ